MKSIFPYFLKGFGAFLSIAGLLLALHYLENEDLKNYFRFAAFANIFLVLARSSVDFLANFSGLESDIHDDKLTIGMNFISIALNRLMYLSMLVVVFFIISWQPMSPYLFLIFSPIFLYISSIFSEFLKGAGFSNVSIFIGDILPSIPMLYLLIGYFLNFDINLVIFVICYLLGSFIAAIFSFFYVIAYCKVNFDEDRAKSIISEKSALSLFTTNMLSGPGIRHLSVIFLSYFTSDKVFSLFVLIQRLLTQYRMILQVIEAIYMRAFLGNIKILKVFLLDVTYKKAAFLSLSISLLAALCISIISEYILDFIGVNGSLNKILFIVSNFIFAVSGLFISSRRIAYLLLSGSSIVYLSACLFILFFTSLCFLIYFDLTYLAPIIFSIHILIQGAAFFFISFMAHRINNGY